RLQMRLAAEQDRSSRVSFEALVLLEITVDLVAQGFLAFPRLERFLDEQSGLLIEIEADIIAALDRHLDADRLAAADLTRAQGGEGIPLIASEQRRQQG